MNKDHCHRKSCMWIFKLETGVTSIVYIDIMMFIFAFTTSNIKLKPFMREPQEMRGIGQYGLNDEDIANQRDDDQFLLFNILTDYTMLSLFAVKIYFAVRFVINLIWVGRMDEEFLLQEFGQNKWETRVLSR